MLHTSNFSLDLGETTLPEPKLLICRPVQALLAPLPESERFRVIPVPKDDPDRLDWPLGAPKVVSQVVSPTNLVTWHPLPVRGHGPVSPCSCCVVWHRSWRSEKPIGTLLPTDVVPDVVSQKVLTWHSLQDCDQRLL